MRPIGIGRRAVRVIAASISASYHMLSAPAAPARAMTTETWQPSPSSLDPRQHVELMERRRRRQRPFERRRAGAPWIVGRALAAQEGLGHAEEEDQHAEARDVRADRRHDVPA